MERKSYQEYIEKFSSKAILVVGDLMLDYYTNGLVERVSPEAPVLVLRKKNDSYVLGGAANVAKNLLDLGAQVGAVGVLGDDLYGQRVKKMMEELGINSSAILVSKERQTTLKHRFVTDSHQLLRVDDESTAPVSLSEEKMMIKKIREVVKEYDAVCISDYAKGVVTKNLIFEVIKIAHEAGKLVMADLKPQKAKCFLGCDLITPNLKEGRSITGLENRDEVLSELIRLYKCKVILTLGSDGAICGSPVDEIVYLPARKIQVFDVSGAGDTFFSVATLSLLAGLDLEASARLANYASEIKVQKSGTATVTINELSRVVEGHRHIDDVVIVPKIWGSEQWLENNDKYCCKILTLNKGFQCSLHYHKIKDETFLITRGHVLMELEDEIMHLKAGNFIRIKPGAKHRFTGVEDSEIIEISTHHMDEDSYRLEESRAVSN